MRKTTAESNYEYADKVLAALVKKIPRLLNNVRLRLTAFDEINVGVVRRLMSEEYQKIEDEAINAYLEIAKQIYREAYYYAVKLGFEGQLRPYDLAMINDWLLDYDATTGYVFVNEFDRKRDRLIEKTVSLAMKGSSLNDSETMVAYKRASKYISDQIIEYGDEITFQAMEKAYADCEVKKVRWLSEYDNKVCETCLSYSGLVFPIDRVPPKPHWGCRCWLIPER